MRFLFECSAVTHIGNRRRNNEDNFFIGSGTLLSPEEQRSMSQTQNRMVRKATCLDGGANRIYAVSDGIGGHRDGEAASRIAVETLSAFSQQRQTKSCGRRREKYAFIQAFQDMIGRANGKMLSPAGGSDPDGMGATLTGVLCFADEAVAFNIGDSSTFLYENGSIQKLTVDDNEAERFQGTDPALLEAHGRRLTKYLGMPRSCGALTARISPPVPLRPGQIYLAASDGLTGCLPPDELARAIREAGCAPGPASVRLVEAALEQEGGGSDNITAVLVKVLSR